MTARPMRPRSALGTRSAFSAGRAGEELEVREEEGDGGAPPSLMFARRALHRRKNDKHYPMENTEEVPSMVKTAASSTPERLTTLASRCAKLRSSRAAEFGAGWWGNSTATKRGGGEKGMGKERARRGINLHGARHGDGG